MILQTVLRFATARLKLEGWRLGGGPVAAFLPRCRVRGNRQQVLIAETAYNRLHQVGPQALARPLLHVVELAHGVARGPAGDSWNRTETSEVGTMADRASRRLASASRCDQRLASLQAANRHVRREPGVRIAKSL